ncbi:hypothetical protein APHAL10511_003168 [Amanita phalloides]|nr:hypothetical protein APHAL10511_003168 [Amanita phalloides]
MEVLIIQPAPLNHDKRKDRSSTENSIISIYSMYGEDAKDIPTVSLTLPNDHENTFFSPADFEGTQLAYYGRHSSRPSSSYAGSSSPRTASDRLFDDHRTSAHSSTFSTSSANGRESLASSSKSDHSPSQGSQSSSSSRSPLSVRDLPPLPPSRASLRDLPPLPPSRASTPASHISVRSHGIRNSSSRSPLAHSPNIPSSSLRSPEQLAVQESCPSKSSLAPSEGEDMDAFHVRSTYAQLEVSGVKGDGYEDGVERTRARLHMSQASQQFAVSTPVGGVEKKGDLDPREIQTLASVDRYGFFVLPSHDRLVLLNSAPLLKKFSRTHGSGSISRLNILNSLPASPKPVREAIRIAKWTRMLKPQARDPGGNIQAWRIRFSKEIKLRERTYKGIPDCWRSAAWDMLLCRHAAAGPGQIVALAKDYRETLEKPSLYDIQIDLDVPRTIGGHVMFRTRYGAGQRSLFRVLHSFSLCCSACGYVQGMGPIAATLLNYFEPERVYASLVRLHDAFSLHSVFSPGFPGMLEAIYVQERIMESFMPSVYAAFKRHTISTTSYATKWYITLFANSVPFQVQLRLWDAFLLDGYDVFIATAIAIIWVYRNQITSTSANFETILSLLSSFFVPEDENVLMSWIEKTLGDKKLRASMRQWREDWKALVASGNDASALL